MPFVASIQHARNANLMIQCEDCGMWGLVHSKKKLKKEATLELENALDNFAFSCGSNIADLDLPENFADVHFRDLECADSVE